MLRFLPATVRIKNVSTLGARGLISIDGCSYVSVSVCVSARVCVPDTSAFYDTLTDNLFVS